MRRIDDHPLGRHYETPDGPVPSVTTVLGATRSKRDEDALEAWRRYVGHEYADQVRVQAAKRGSMMHAEIEDTVEMGWPSHPSPWLESIRREVETAARATNRVSECYVYSKKYGYAGTLDMLGDVDGRTILWEWKGYLPASESKRRDPPLRVFNEDYILQGRAYAKAAGSTLFRQVDELRVCIARCKVLDDKLVPLPAQIIAVKREDPEYADLWSRFEMRLGLWSVYRATRAVG